MAKPLPEFVSHCAELMAPLGAVRIQPMFGGHGLYVDELFIAIVTGDRLFLKVNDETQPRFEQAGGEPFEYPREGKTARLNYRTVPAEAMESPALMTPWVRLAMAAALRARAAGPAPGIKRPAARQSRR